MCSGTRNTKDILARRANHQRAQQVVRNKYGRKFLGRSNYAKKKCGYTKALLRRRDHTTRRSTGLPGSPVSGELRVILDFNRKSSDHIIESVSPLFVGESLNMIFLVGVISENKDSFLKCCFGILHKNGTFQTQISKNGKIIEW